MRSTSVRRRTSMGRKRSVDREARRRRSRRQLHHRRPRRRPQLRSRPHRSPVRTCRRCTPRWRGRAPRSVADAATRGVPLRKSPIADVGGRASGVGRTSRVGSVRIAQLCAAIRARLLTRGDRLFVHVLIDATQRSLRAVAGPTALETRPLRAAAYLRAYGPVDALIRPGGLGLVDAARLSRNRALRATAGNRLWRAARPSVGSDRRRAIRERAGVGWRRRAVRRTVRGDEECRAVGTTAARDEENDRGSKNSHLLPTSARARKSRCSLSAATGERSCKIVVAPS